MCLYRHHVDLPCPLPPLTERQTASSAVTRFLTSPELLLQSVSPDLGLVDSLGISLAVGMDLLVYLVFNIRTSLVLYNYRDTGLYE